MTFANPGGEKQRQVYCKSCYENRTQAISSASARKKKTASASNTDGKTAEAKFRVRAPSGGSGSSKAKVLCAIEDCESEVGNKAAWVGLFL